MRELKRVFPIVLLHYIAGLAICLVYTFLQPLSVSLIPPFILSWRLRSAILLFITYMPALQISGILVGYAIAFSHQAEQSVDRWSSQLFSSLKEAFKLSLVLLSVYIVLVEGVGPVMQTRKDSAVTRTEDFHDYLTVSRALLADGKPAEAEFRLRSALDIWKGSPEAQKLIEDSRLKLAELSGGKPKADETKLPDPLVPRDPVGLTVLGALDLAAEAEKGLDFYNAHYYAMLAYRLAARDDPNRDAALRMAASAWNRITGGTDTLRARGDTELYGTKRKGYDAIQNGDYLTAYYIFLDLFNADRDKGDGQRDPDVERFLEVLRKGVLESFFFADETASLRLFESARDIFFLVRGANGMTDAVSIRGVTYTRASGRDVAYLRDFEIARFDQNDALLYRMYAPQAKMFSYSADGKNFRPEILLHAVDRAGSGGDIVPLVLDGEAPDQDLSILLLDMPYRDFNMIVSANRGPMSMIMTDLMRFAGRAESYGFDPAVYMREALHRLSDPFLILIISILALVAGWRFHLGKDVLFKAWWMLVVPLFSVLSLLIIALMRYLAGLWIVAFVAIVPDYATVLTLSLQAVLFAAASFFFFSQRSD